MRSSSPQSPCSKIAPALMAGNTVVLKPPTQGAVAGVLMVQCFAAAGLPAGVLNCVTGGCSKGGWGRGGLCNELCGRQWRQSHLLSCNTRAGERTSDPAC